MNHDLVKNERLFRYLFHPKTNRSHLSSWKSGVGQRHRQISQHIDFEEYQPDSDVMYQRLMT
jgi:hypothetical protein